MPQSFRAEHMETTDFRITKKRFSTTFKIKENVLIIITIIVTYR